MKLIKEKSGIYIYALESEFSTVTRDYCRALKKFYGWENVGFTGRKWRFSIVDALDSIINKFPDEIDMDEDVRKDYEKWNKNRLKMKKTGEEIEALKSSKKVDGLNIDGLKGELYEYQKVGVSFLMKNKGSAIIADEPGSGKTLQSLAYIVKANHKKTLVICPASVKLSWEKEVAKWTNLKPLVLHSKSLLSDEEYEDYDIFIINYDILNKLLSRLLSLKFNCMIADEMHALKNPDSKRTKAATALAENIKSKVMLSGTPVLNRPIELYGILKMLYPELWPSWYTYARKYCDLKRTRFGLDTSGASNLSSLREKLSPYFLRRTKKEILPELPERFYIDIPVEMESSLAAEYRDTEETFLDMIKNRNKFSVTMLSTISPDEKMELAGTELKMMMDLRQISSKGKIYAAIELIDQIISNDEKVIVFSSFNAPLEELKERYGDAAVMVTGKVSYEDRKKAVQKFQEDKSVKIFFGGLRSAGEGITLTAANNVLFLDYGLVPAHHEQAADRCHRPGQKAEKITIYQLYSPGTIDEKIKDLILDLKERTINELVDGGALKQEYRSKNIITDVIDSYLKLNT